MVFNTKGHPLGLGVKPEF